MKDIHTKIFDFAYGAGLHDATAQRAFEGEKKYLRECESAKKIVKEYIDAVIDGNKVDFYDTARKIEKCYNDYIKSKNKEHKFTFGNTQKLINMTVKNMYTVVYIDESLRKNFEQCHCPMDNKMINIAKVEIEKVKRESQQLLPKTISDFLQAKNWKGQLSASWSNMVSDNYDSKKQYEIFQEIIRFLAEREGVSAIEYDYLVWDKEKE